MKINYNKKENKVFFKDLPLESLFKIEGHDFLFLKICPLYYSLYRQYNSYRLGSNPTSHKYFNFDPNHKVISLDAELIIKE